MLASCAPGLAVVNIDNGYWRRDGRVENSRIASLIRAVKPLQS